MWDQKHNGSKLWARFKWLRVWWWKWTVNHVQHHRQCQVCFHFKTSSPSSSASGHVYNFSPCNTMLNVAGNHSLQSSLSQSKRAYKGNMFQDSYLDWAVFCSNKSISNYISVGRNAPLKWALFFRNLAFWQCIMTQVFRIKSHWINWSVQFDWWFVVALIE